MLLANFRYISLKVTTVAGNKSTMKESNKTKTSQQTSEKPKTVTGLKRKPIDLTENSQKRAKTTKQSVPPEDPSIHTPEYVQKLHRWMYSSGFILSK